MNRILLLGLALGISTCAIAQNKLDAGSRARMRSANMPLEFVKKSGAPARVQAKDLSHTNYLRAFATLSPNANVANLEAAGATVHSHRGTMALIEFPQDALADIEALDGILKLSLERPLEAKLDIAREVSGINKIHSGLDLPQAYTGKGVVAGSVDGGFDPNHINFKNNDGTTRFGQFTYYRPTQAGSYVQQIVPGDEIGVIDTESDETYHGTHTLGIMAGSYRGDVRVAVPGLLLNEYQTIPNPYYGVAYDAEIAAASGATTDYYIALGCETILDYAYNNGQKPAVINLSLGSNVGPHDGTSTICQYMDLASTLDKVIFCVSAGNEGDLPIAMHKTFSADDNSIASILKPEVEMTNYKNVRYGATYIYSNNDQPFEVQLVIVNLSRGMVAMRMPLEASPEGASRYWASGSEYTYDETDIVSAQFARYFTGYAGIGAELDAQSGRYYAVLDLMLWDNTSTNADGNYVLGFEITGADGQRVDIFNDGVYNTLSSYGVNGYEDGSTDGTISDLACGHNYVVVGSYNTRDEWISLDLNTYGNEVPFEYGKASFFSSYGELYDGRRLPTVCAPGTSIISSSNEYYLDSYAPYDGMRQADLVTGDRRYSWHQSTGTSMSTPLVSGAIALWLEAYPDLNYSQVLEIIRETAIVDDDVRQGNPIQWGAGKFDAYAGLKKVLEIKDAGIGNVATDSECRLLISAIGNRKFGIHFAGQENFTATLYSVAGTEVAKATANGSEACIDATELPAGVYILAVPGAKAERILVK
ncbi:MAG: S8 family serine peptidase [Muribaculaceae bacterium]|nr:S8 family serine peptidase [Muribaculaceae bacterium]